MSTIINYLNIVFTDIKGVLEWFLGDINSTIYALISFVVLDYFTGVLIAICQKRVSSKIGHKAIFKKVMIFVLVGLGNILDLYIVKSGDSIRTMIIMFYLCNEGISILENAAEIGLPLPKKLKQVFLQIDKSYESKENKDNKIKDDNV